MKHKLVVFALVLLVIITLVVPASAHSGRTDANGGHYDHSTGEYHYHHGYPPHQHVNGVCPYDYDDNTAHTSESTKNDSDNRTIQKSSPDIKSNKPIEKRSFGYWVAVIFAVLFFGYIAVVLLLGIGIVLWYSILQPIFLKVKSWFKKL